MRIGLGFLLAGAGATSLILGALYRGPSGLALVTFGLFSLFYGILILLQAPSIAGLLDISTRTRIYAIVWISYAVPGLGMLYAETIRGRGWLSLLRRFWQFGLPLAAGFAVYDLVVGRPAAAFPAYQVYLVAALLVLLPHVILFHPHNRVERYARAIGTGLLTSSLIVDTISRFLSWPLNLETYGIAIFVLAQGVVTARRFFADQRELAAVEREFDMARTIQASILPRQVPTASGLRIAVRYLPARSVAGDLYDFLQVDDQRLGVLVADVAGHGLSAALIASMTTVAFASQRPHASDTARTLAEMNRVLCGHFEARYVTAAYAFIDTERRYLRYSLGGHPPPLLWRARSRVIEKLSEGSIVLGLLEHAAFSSTEVPLEQGDRLILYTDGLTEVQNRDGQWFGDAELEAFIDTHAGLEAAAFIDALLGYLAKWSGRDSGSVAPSATQSRFDDDLTIVLVDC